jgi:hypothetical protein
MKKISELTVNSPQLAGLKNGIYVRHYVSIIGEIVGSWDADTSLAKAAGKVSLQVLRWAPEYGCP